MQGADFIYDYSYKDESEHLERLKRAMMLVCADYEEDRELIKNRGKAAYEYVKQVHSDAIVGEKYAEIYRTLCRGKTHV